jgi:hypothetical protein
MNGLIDSPGPIGTARRRSVLAGSQLDIAITESDHRRSGADSVQMKTVGPAIGRLVSRAPRGTQFRWLVMTCVFATVASAAS